MSKPHSTDLDILKKRSAAIFEIDNLSKYRKAHENPAILELYNSFLGEPDGPKSLKLLHTLFHNRNIANVALRPSQATIAVLYASVGGTTEGVARRIYNDLKGCKLNAELLPMNNCVASSLKEVHTVIILSCTWGEGALPPMSKNVWDWLEEQPSGTLRGINFAVFGLGASKYTYFNLAAKKFDQKMESLGASRIIEVGLGDKLAYDAHNAALDPWLACLYEKLAIDPPS